MGEAMVRRLLQHFEVSTILDRYQVMPWRGTFGHFISSMACRCYSGTARGPRRNTWCLSARSWSTPRPTLQGKPAGDLDSRATLKALLAPEPWAGVLRGAGWTSCSSW